MTKRVVCFGSHPDDIEIGCGGTVAKYIAAGAYITFVCYTSGEAGHASMPKAELSAIREAEALRAAGCLGVSDVRFLRFQDGLMAATYEMKIRVIGLLRELRPDAVFTHATCDGFPDHKIFSELTRQALTAAAGPWYQESEGKPHQVSEVYGYEVWHPLSQFQLVVDVSEFFPRKLQALKQYESQVEYVAYDKAAAGLAQYRAVMAFQAGYAEVFEVIKANAALV